jgi:MFS transporter, PAT family, beta-lactamase induction signal transducer AmpG
LRIPLPLLESVSGRRVLFAACYFSEGAPIGFIWWALPTKLRAAGVSVETTASISALLVLPWVFKFLWAPVIDIGRTVRWGHRAWILTLQLFMGLTLLPLMMLDFNVDQELLVGFLLLHAVIAATQDAAIDGFAIAIVPLHERGSLNGWMQFGMLLGRSLLGGGVLLLESSFGTKFTLPCLITAIWVPSALLALTDISPALQTLPVALPQRVSEFGVRMKKMLLSRNTWFVLLFAAIGGAGFEGVGAVAGPFLLDQGFSKQDVGLFFSIPSVIGMMAGALVGGVLADRLDRRHAAALTLSLVALDVVGLAVATAHELGVSPDILLFLLGLLYVFIGMFTATSYALFMDATEPGLGATQFSAFMGATNGCEAWASYTVGKLQGTLGYSLAFSALAGVSLLALPIIKTLRFPSRKSHGVAERSGA